MEKFVFNLLNFFLAFFLLIYLFCFSLVYFILFYFTTTLRFLRYIWIFRTLWQAMDDSFRQ